MQRIERKHIALFLAGTAFVSASFILRHYFPLSDSADGFLKGMGIGFLILTLLLISRHQKGIKRNPSVQ